MLLLLALLAATAGDPIVGQLRAMQPKLVDASLPDAPQYVVWERWKNGKPKTIFARLVVESDGEAAMVAFRVTRSGALQWLIGVGRDYRSIELRDITGDGRLEILAVLPPGMRATPIDIYRWNGQEFVEIGGMSDHSRVIDLDGDGVNEIVDGKYVQKLRGGKYVSVGRR